MKTPEYIDSALELIDGQLRHGLLGVLSDVILLLDERARVLDIQCQSSALQRIWSKNWSQRAWLDTVTDETRPKIDDLLSCEDGPSAGRQVNHPIAGQPDVPITYSTVKIPGGWLAFGRDMRAISDMQQQLVRFQIGKERDFARIRAFETRFRILAETISDPVLVVDTANLTVVEHNRAAKNLLAPKSRRQLTGRQLPDLLASDQVKALTDTLASAKSSGQQQESELLLGDDEFDLVASPFRQEGANLLVVRLNRRGGHTPLNGKTMGNLAWAGTPMTFDNMPDGIVTTDLEGVIVAANEAFVELCGLSSVEQIIGANLSRWLGRPGVDLGVLLGQLRSHGRVQAYNTTISGNYGTIAQIEVTAAADTSREVGRATFLIRDLGHRSSDKLTLNDALPQSATELTQLIGRVPLKELVRQTTDVIERLCIESALEITNENRASAAELLGLSRQGLYVKLRRYGIIEDAEQN